MSRRKVLRHEFVELIPTELRDGTIYVSIPYATAVHKCVCGCGNRVVTPLTPTDWQLTYDGETISLEPSIGNWSFPCRSHYWLRQNSVVWARQWSQHEIDTGRERDRQTKDRYYDKRPLPPPRDSETGSRKGVSFWRRLKRRFF